MDIHPCVRCGACCVIYRVSFHWSETLADSFQVPEKLTRPVGPHQLALKTTTPTGNRCASLKGNIGVSVGCQIYENRPSPCRNFKASFESGQHEPRCDEARKTVGLLPLSPQDWLPSTPIESEMTEAAL